MILKENKKNRKMFIVADLVSLIKTRKLSFLQRFLYGLKFHAKLS